MNSNFTEVNKDGRSYLRLKKFDELGVINGFTRRTGGVSRGKITGFNFGFRVGDDPDDVLMNYKLLAEDMGFDVNRTVCARQQHTDNIRIVSEADCGKGVIVVDSDIRDTDGLITNIPGIPLVVFTADCVPLLFFDPVNRVIAATHAGWRGTAQKIGKKTVGLMKSEFGGKPENIIAAIGPSIGACCFEVDRATAENFDERYRIPKPNDKFHVDLWAVNKDDLLDEGMKPGNIYVSGECTICNSDKYYSYRTHKEHTGRQVAVISLV